MKLVTSRVSCEWCESVPRNHIKLWNLSNFSHMRRVAIESRPLSLNLASHPVTRPLRRWPASGMGKLGTGSMNSSISMKVIHLVEQSSEESCHAVDKNSKDRDCPRDRYRDVTRGVHSPRPRIVTPASPYLSLNPDTYIAKENWSK